MQNSPCVRPENTALREHSWILYFEKCTLFSPVFWCPIKIDSSLQGRPIDHQAWMPLYVVQINWRVEQKRKEKYLEWHGGSTKGIMYHGTLKVFEPRREVTLAKRKRSDTEKKNEGARERPPGAGRRIDPFLLFCLTTYQSPFSSSSLLSLPPSSPFLSFVPLSLPSSLVPSWLVTIYYRRLSFRNLATNQTYSTTTHTQPIAPSVEKNLCSFDLDCPSDKKFVCSFSRRNHLPGIRVLTCYAAWAQVSFSPDSFEDKKTGNLCETRNLNFFPTQFLFVELKIK